MSNSLADTLRKLHKVMRNGYYNRDLAELVEYIEPFAEEELDQINHHMVFERKKRPLLVTSFADKFPDRGGKRTYQQPVVDIKQGKIIMIRIFNADDDSSKIYNPPHFDELGPVIASMANLHTIVVGGEKQWLINSGSWIPTSVTDIRIYNTYLGRRFFEELDLDKHPRINLFSIPAYIVEDDFYGPYYSTKVSRINLEKTTTLDLDEYNALREKFL